MDCLERMNTLYDRCSPLFRDTEMPPGVLEKHKVGLFLREPTFCDVTNKFGGFIGPHRYLIVAVNARCLDGLGEDTGWGLCIFQTGRMFKVIDKIGNGVHTQVTLLEVPPDLVECFSKPALNNIEKSLVAQSRDAFRQALALQPLPELNNERWKKRLIYPIGIDNSGGYFSLQRDPMAPNGVIVPDQLGFRLSRVLNHQAQIHSVAGDPSEAEPLLMNAIELEQGRAEPDHEAMAISYFELANIYDRDLNVPIRAQQSLRESLLHAKQLDEKLNPSLVPRILQQLSRWN